MILRTRIKDSFTLDDMLQKVGKENTSKSASLPEFDRVTEEPADTAGNEREIRRIQELIRDNERELGAGITVPVQQPVASRGKEKPALQEKKEEEVRPEQRKAMDSVPGTGPQGIQHGPAREAGREECHQGVRTLHTDRYGRFHP
ncbi:hypothetical protein NXV68_07415 [Bacteroides fragilis]|nr:hypothetical protein [Bacteroides fragilis]